MSEQMALGDVHEKQTAAQRAQCFMEEFNDTYSAEGLSTEEKIARLDNLAHREASFDEVNPSIYASNMLVMASRRMISSADGYVKNLSQSVVVQIAENGTSLDELVRLAESNRRQTVNPRAALLANSIVEMGNAVKRDLTEQRSAERKVGREEALVAMKANAKTAGYKAVEVTRKITHDLPVAPVARVAVAGTALAAIAVSVTFTPAAATPDLATSIPTGMQMDGVRVSATNELQAVNDDDVISIPGAHFKAPEARIELINLSPTEPQAPLLGDDVIELPPDTFVESPLSTPETGPEEDGVIPLPPGTEIISPKQQPAPKDDEVIPLPPGTEIIPPTPPKEPNPEPTPPANSPAPGETPPKMPVIPPVEPVDPPRGSDPSAPGEQSPKQKTPEQIDKEVQKARDKAFLSEIESYVARAAQSSKHGKPINAKKLYDLLNKYHDKNKHAVIDREFIMSAIWQESTFKPNAVSNVGAKGLGQFMPGTAKEMGLDDPFDPEDSVRAAYGYYIKIYKIMEGRFPDKSKAELTDMTLAGYNAGPYHKRLMEGELPQNEQTQGYIRIINGLITHVDKAEAKAEKKVRVKYDNDEKPPEENPGDGTQEKKPKELKVVGWGEGAGGKHELTYFNQRSDEWADKPYRKNNSPESSGTIEVCGCGPSALSMSIATMTGKKTDPVKMSEWFMNHGGPVSSSNCASNWIWETQADNFESDFGVKIKRISGTDEAIKKAIDKGGMVIMSQGSGMFTSGGHIMMVTGYVKAANKDGGNHKYLVGDSNSTRKTVDLEGYSPSVMIGNGSPVPGVGLGGVGADRGYLKAAWSITPIKSEVKSTSSEAPSPIDVDVAPTPQLEIDQKDSQSPSTPTETAPDLLDVLAAREAVEAAERERIDALLFGDSLESSVDGHQFELADVKKGTHDNETTSAKERASSSEAVDTPEMNPGPRALGEGELFKVRHDDLQSIEHDATNSSGAVMSRPNSKAYDTSSVEFREVGVAIDNKAIAKVKRQRDAKIQAEINEIKRNIEIQKEIEQLQKDLDKRVEAKS